MQMKSVIAAFALFGLVGVVQAAGDAAAGKQKAAGCAGCHGSNGEGNGSNPPLAGMAPEQFAKAIGEYKAGTRKNTAMKSFTAKLTPQEIENLAAYYASLAKK